LKAWEALLRKILGESVGLTINGFTTEGHTETDWPHSLTLHLSNGKKLNISGENEEEETTSNLIITMEE
jgi:hypothetical protein